MRALCHTILIGAGTVLLLPEVLLASPALMPGDEILMTVVGVPELQRQVDVEADGTLSLPLFGELDVAGMTLDELRDELRIQLSGKSFVQQDPEGVPRQVRIQPDNFSLDLISRPPIFVIGAVTTQGEYPYANSLDVRRAVALAGGVDLASSLGPDPLLESIDLSSEYEMLLLERLEAQTTIWRLEAELAGETELQTPPDLDTASVPDLVEETFRRDQQLLEMSVQQRAQEREHLEAALARTDEQIETLSQQIELQRAEVEASTRDLQRTQELSDRGLVDSSRVANQRQSMHYATTVGLDATIELLQVQEDRDQVLRDLERLEGEWQLETVAALSEARLRLEETEVRLDSVLRKLMYTGGLESVRLLDEEPEVTYLIYRDLDGQSSELEATPSTPLLPGDVLEVELDLAAPMLPE